MYAVILTLLTLTLQAAAERIAVTVPGCLQTSVADADAVISLSLEGEIDARDLSFIAAAMPSLRTLDLSRVRIVPFGDEPADHIPACSFAGSPLTDVKFPLDYPLSIGDMAFMGSDLTLLDLPPSVCQTGIGAFAGCPRLKEVVLTGKTILGAHAFADCNHLSVLRLNSVDSLPASAFSGCGNLKDIEGEYHLRHIGAKAFSACSALDNFDFGQRLSYIGDDAFTNSGLTVADMSPCTSLREISPWAFSHCSSLSSVILPPALTAVPEGLLFDAPGLFELSLPASVSDIADVALCTASALDSLALPAGLENIGTLAMNRLAALEVIDAGKLSAVPSLGDDVWDNVDCSSVRLIADVTLADVFAAADQWNAFNIMVHGSLSSAPAVNGDASVRLRIDGRRLIVSSPAGLKKVSVYDCSGRLLASGRSDKNEYYYDNDSGSALLLVETITADGGISSDKILIN